jgi:hypothetical protein
VRKVLAVMLKAKMAISLLLALSQSHEQGQMPPVARRDKRRLERTPEKSIHAEHPWYLCCIRPVHKFPA